MYFTIHEQKNSEIKERERRRRRPIFEKGYTEIIGISLKDLHVFKGSRKSLREPSKYTLSASSGTDKKSQKLWSFQLKAYQSLSLFPSLGKNQANSIFCRSFFSLLHCELLVEEKLHSDTHTCTHTVRKKENTEQGERRRKTVLRQIEGPRKTSYITVNRKSRRVVWCAC